MGINANVLRFLLRAKNDGVDFSRTAMIGRQGLHLSFELFSHILNDEYQCDLDDAELKAIHENFYAEKLFSYLGASLVHSFDYSDYEGATCVHDFNKPIPENAKGQYTFVLDGGTLEHVFNFPIALKGCMEMLAVGGSIVATPPANNDMGHGFYQISPELYFAAFDESNGFYIDEIYITEGRETKAWYEVLNPKMVRKRAALTNTRPTLLLVRASRQISVVIFERPPQQFDYITAWRDQSESVTPMPVKKSRSWIRTILPSIVVRWLICLFSKALDLELRARILTGISHDQEVFKKVMMGKTKSRHPR